MFRALVALALAATFTACGSTAASQNAARPTSTAAIGLAVATATPATTLPPSSVVAAPAPQTATLQPTTPPRTPCTTSANGTIMAGQALLVDVRVGAHDGYDRVVLEFASRQAPTRESSTYEIAPATAPFTQDASGLPVSISGNPVLSLVLRGATSATLDGRSAYDGSHDFVTRFRALNEFKSRGDFEAVSSWLAGLNGTACVKAQILTSPTRLVIDFAHP